MDTSSSYEVRTVNGLVGALRRSRDSILVKTHPLTPPTILWCCPSFGLDPTSIGQRKGTLQVLTKFAPSKMWLVHCVYLGIGFHEKSPNDSTHHIVMLPKFEARSDINWSKKRDTSCSYEVRTVNRGVGGLYRSGDWISLKTHPRTPPTILWCCPNFGLDPTSIGQRKGTLQVVMKSTPKMD